MTEEKRRQCPKCGSFNVNSETVREEPRYHWCMDCRHGAYHAFPLKPYSPSTSVTERKVEE